MDEKDIINKVLNVILNKGGKVPYTFVINPEHDSDTQERMKKIVENMQREKLLIIPPDEYGDFELGVHGSQAASIGYKKFKRMKRWNSLSHNATVIFFIFILAGGAIGLLYLLLHYFKII